MRKSIIAAICAAVLGGLTATFAPIPAARADMQVLESNAPAYPVGSKLPDDAQPKLQPGETVKVLLSSNRTQVFEGPRTKPAGPAGGTRSPMKKPD